MLWRACPWLCGFPHQGLGGMGLVWRWWRWLHSAQEDLAENLQDQEAPKPKAVAREKPKQ